MAAGPKFAVAVTDTGLQLFGLGALVLAARVLPIHYPHGTKVVQKVQSVISLQE